jgi:hypothetical protein
MISSQQAKPPPRSLAHHHHPLRGVITTKGAMFLFVPDTTVVTLNAWTCSCSTCVVSMAFEPCRAQSAEYRRTKRMQKAVGIAWTKSRTCPARYDDDRLMSVLAACLTQRAGLRTVRWNFSEPNRRITIEVPEGACDSCRARESAVK